MRLGVLGSSNRVMRKVILFSTSSLEGYIAGLKGEIDRLFSDQGYGYTG